MVQDEPDLRSPPSEPAAARAPEPTPDAATAPAALRRQAVRGGTLFMVARLGLQAFQWSVTLLVARLLEPEDYSFMTLGALFVGLADLLTQAGVGKALVQKRDADDEDFAQGFTLAAVMALTLYAVLFVSAPLAGAWLGNDDFVGFLRVLALLLLLVPLRSVCGAVMERKLQLGRQSLVLLAGSLVQSSLVLTLAWLGGGYWALAAGSLFGAFAQTLFSWHMAGWRVRLALPARRSWALLRFGLYVSLGSLLWQAYSNADFAVIAGLFDTRTLGFYALAFELMSLPVQKFSANVNQVMFAVFSRCQDDPSRRRDWYLRVVALMTLPAAPAMAGLGLVAADGLPLLLGEHWRPAVLPFQILCPVGILMIVATSLAQYVAACGRPDVNLRYNAACLVVYPPAFWLAGSLFGLPGVCFVWPLLYPCMVALLTHLSRHITGITLGDLLASQRLVLVGTLLMTAAVLAVQWLLRDAAPAARLAAAIATGVTTYTAFVLLAGRATLLADLRKVWRDLRGRPATA